MKRLGRKTEEEIKKTKMWKIMNTILMLGRKGK
jgi:hypothetical protein